MIASTLPLLLLSALSICSAAPNPKADGDFEFIILHNNDMHARFEQTSSYSNKCSNVDIATNKCYGGFPRVAHVVRDYRARAALKEISPVLFLNAGDTYVGTPWFALYKDNITADFLNLLKPDAMSWGNHEFDEGVANVAHFLSEIDFPVLSANMDFSKVPELVSAPNVAKSKVFEIEGVKVGVIGYLTPETATLSAPNDVEYEDEIVAINAEAALLKSQGVNIIIGLGHSGIARDLEIAAGCPEIDLIIGGHSHTFLYTGNQPDNDVPQGTFPIDVTQPGGKVVPVVQAYAFTKYLGHLKMTFDINGNLIKFDGTPLLLNAAIPRDPEFLQLLEIYRPGILALEQEIVGHTKVFLDGDCRQKECNLGNFIADSLVDYNAIHYTENEFWTDAAIGFFQSGGIRTSIELNLDGSITMADVHTLLPFENNIVLIEVTGQQLWDALEHSVFRAGQDGGPAGEFMQYSGIEVTYDYSKPSGQRVVSALALCAQCLVPVLEPIDLTKEYKILTVSFISTGGDGYEMLAGNLVKDLGVSEMEVFIEFLKKRSPIYPSVEWRITILNDNPEPSTTPSLSTIAIETTTDGAITFTLSFGVMVLSAILCILRF